MIGSFLYYNIDQLLYVAIALLIAFSVHEFSHAYVAYKYGDLTAKRAGRLTLNPFAHLDLFGTAMIFLAGFGWAKPVPVNFYNLRQKRYASVFISLAGPFSNLIIAALTLGLGYLLAYVGIVEALIGTQYLEIVINLINIIINLNIILFLFNLIPIPPLDGYRIVEGLLPISFKPKLAAIEAYGPFLLLLLILTPLGDYIFGSVLYSLKDNLLTVLNNFYSYLFRLS